ATIRRPFTPADLTAELAAAGVDGTVLVEGGRCHPDEAAEFLGYAADTAPILAVVAWLDVAADDVAATVERYRGLRGGDHLAGVRSQVQGEADPDYLDRPDVRRGLAELAAAGLVFDLVIRADQLPAAARAARALPQLRFVLDHLGKPRIDEGGAGLRRWRGPLADLAACPNVTAKLSGLVTEAGPDWTPDDLRRRGPGVGGGAAPAVGRGAARDPRRHRRARLRPGAAGRAAPPGAGRGATPHRKGMTCDATAG
ncbi:amidohydrolase family protein, partial [Micromonospora sp. DH15]|nr:amidohydrolase family protein [Micromonospora sp. DH15]